MKPGISVSSSFNVKLMLPVCCGYVNFYYIYIINFKQREMKTLKTLLLSFAILSGSALMAQQDDVRKKFEKNGDLVEATFYHENSRVAQKGFFKDGKLHGEWIAYDQNGNKTAIGRYYEGQKVGKWFFWNGDVLSEVDFQESRIASVNNWKNENDLVSN